MTYMTNRFLFKHTVSVVTAYVPVDESHARGKLYRTPIIFITILFVCKLAPT